MIGLDISKLVDFHRTENSAIFDIMESNSELDPRASIISLINIINNNNILISNIDKNSIFGTTARYSFEEINNIYKNDFHLRKEDLKTVIDELNSNLVTSIIDKFVEYVDFVRRYDFSKWDEYKNFYSLNSLEGRVGKLQKRDVLLTIPLMYPSNLYHLCLTSSFKKYVDVYLEEDYGDASTDSNGNLESFNRDELIDCLGRVKKILNKLGNCLSRSITYEEDPKLVISENFKKATAFIYRRYSEYHSFLLEKEEEFYDFDSEISTQSKIRNLTTQIRELQKSQYKSKFILGNNHSKEKALKCFIYILSKLNPETKNKKVHNAASALIQELFYIDWSQHNNTKLSSKISLNPRSLIELIEFFTREQIILANGDKSAVILSKSILCDHRGFSYKNLIKLQKKSQSKKHLDFNNITSTIVLKNEMR